MAAEKVTVVTIFFRIIVAEAIVNPHGPTVVLDVTNCINSLMENNFIEPGVLIFTTTNNPSPSISKITAELLNKIHKKLTYVVEVKSPQNEINVCNEHSGQNGVLHRDIYEVRPLGAYYFIVVDYHEDVPFIIARLVRSRSWNPSAKFVLLFFSFSEIETNIKFAEKIVSCLFKYNVINVVVVVPQANDLRKSIIYSWRPFDPPKYCGYYNETAKGRLFVVNACNKGVLKYKTSFPESEVPRDMNGCILHIIALEREPFVSRYSNESNIEKILINEVAKRNRLSTSYKIIDEYRGERESEGNWNGALKELTLKRGQVLMGGIFPDFDVHEDFECSVSYLADSYTWIVPRAYQSPPWIALLIIFQKPVWYAVIAGYFVCALFWRILGQISRDAPRNQSLHHCFLNAWISSMGFCAYLRPTKPCLRLFFVFFTIYCMLVVTGYQTKLIDVLKNPTFEHQIQTIEELVKSGLKIGGTEELHDLFSNSSDPIDSYILKNWIDVGDISQAMIDVTVHRNFSLLCSRLELAHVSAIVPELSDSSGNFKYYAFELNVFSVPMEMVALRGFGYMSRISEGLSLFKQAGINEGVRARFKAFNIRRRAKLLRSLLREKSEVKSLSLQHLQGGFFGLALGYVSGLVIFLLEIIYNTSFIKSRINQRTFMNL